MGAVLVLAPAVLWGLAVVLVDVRTRRIPYTLFASGMFPVLVVVSDTGRGGPALLGSLALTAVYLVARLVSPSGLGGGDLRLATVCGALAGVPGPWSWALAAGGAFVLTALLAVGAVVAARVRGRERPHGVPHGPSMVLATLAVFVPALL